MTRHSDAILAAINDTRRELGDAISGGHAELRHDNAQLRDQLTAAINDGLGELRAENLELRARMDRAATDLAHMRLQVETIRAETAEARTPQPASAEQPGPDEPTPADYQQLLNRAAGIAYAHLECHRDTWDFLVAQAARYEHFRLPSDVEDEDTGLIDVDLSGRTLIAVLDALWHTRHADDTPAGTRALAAQVYERIAGAIDTVQTGSGPQETEPATPTTVEEVAARALEDSRRLLAPESINPDPTPTRRVVTIRIDDRP